MQRRSCEPVLPLQGCNAVCTAHPSTPSTHLSPYPLLLPPPLFLFLCSFFLCPSPPFLPASPTTKPHPQHEKTGRGIWSNHTPRDITSAATPTPYTHMHTRKHTLPPSPLSCPCTPLPLSSSSSPLAFPSLAPPDLLLILHSLQQRCQAVMFFLASPTQFSHSFPLPQHTATSHTPWAQLTHWERRWESFGWAITPSLRDRQFGFFAKLTKIFN